MHCDCKLHYNPQCVLRDKGNVMAEKKKIHSTIGGQAVLEGVMMRGKRSMATAVRDEKGNIQIESSRFTPMSEKSKIRRAPFIRGVINFGSSMVMGISVLLRASEVFEGAEEPTKIEKWCSEKLHFNFMTALMYFSVFLGLCFSIGLFFVLPHFSIVGIRALVENVAMTTIPEYSYNLIEGVIRILIFVAYILLTSTMKEIKRVYMYHGAEHKTISAFEHGLELNVENVQKQTTIHDRCGTTFMFIVMIVSVAFFSLISLLPIQTTNEVANTFIKLAIKIALLPLVAGVSYEILKFLAKFDNWFVSIIKAPGLLMQKFTTKQPTDEMVEVAIAAFNAVQIMDNDLDVKTEKFTTKIIKGKLDDELDKILAGIGEGNCDKEWIIAEVLGIKRSEIADKSFVWSNQFDIMVEMAEKRASGEPLQQIFGYTNFYGMDIKVNKDVLSPRPETEYLVEECSRIIKEYNLKSVLDVATGSGAIALVLKRDNDVSVTGVDISYKALEVAKGNASKNELEITFVQSDLFSNVEGKFDLIVSNPPYIATDVVAGLQTEVKDFEPMIALDGGEDGLDFYRRIIADASEYMNDGGYIAFEIGYDQKVAVTELLSLSIQPSFIDISVKSDLEGNDRIITAKVVL